MVKHELEALARDIARRLPVDRVAEDHVVRRDRLCDRPRGAAGLEELARDLLAGPDLRERPVLEGVQVDRERLLIGGQEFLLFIHSRDIGLCRTGLQPVPVQLLRADRFYWRKRRKQLVSRLI